MTIVGEGYASLCLRRQARARGRGGVMATSSPRVDEEGPVRMETPDSATAGPTVGANCRRGEQTDAIGWQVRGRWTLLVPVRDSALKNAHGRHKMNTRYTQVQGPREEVKPLLLLV